jgi:hypothetical protein
MANSLAYVRWLLRLTVDAGGSPVIQCDKCLQFIVETQWTENDGTFTVEELERTVRRHIEGCGR